jgi:hypothetical protein
MTILSNDDLYAFIGKADTGDQYGSIRDAVEEWLQSYCGRTFGSTVYKERYDGSGSNKLILNQYPVISIERLALSAVDAVRIRCSGATTHAVVSVNSKGIVLRKDGVSNSTVLFATYTTLATVIAAINLISGWEATIESSTYNSYSSTELLEKMGLFCKGTSWAYLSIPYEAEASFDVDSARGIITLYGLINTVPNSPGFPVGIRNIFVDYTAGYSTIPEDVVFAIKIMCQRTIQKNEEKSFGLSSYSIGDVSMSFENNEFPIEVVNIINRYRKLKI